MSRYIIGPEMLWLIIYVFARIFSTLNKAPDHIIDNFIDQCWFWVTILTFLTFGLYWVSGFEKKLANAAHLVRLYIYGASSITTFDVGL